MDQPDPALRKRLDKKLGTSARETIWMCVMSFLDDPRHLAACSLVNLNWYRCASSNLQWAPFCQETLAGFPEYWESYGPAPPPESRWFSPHQEQKTWFIEDFHSLHRQLRVLGPPGDRDAWDIRAKLVEAFDFPLGKGTSISEARALDDYEDKPERFRSRDKEKNWWDLSAGKIEDLHDTLHFMNPEGLHFYLPAFMAHSLTCKNPHCRIHDAVDFKLESAFPNSMEWSPKQRYATALFLQYRDKLDRSKKFHGLIWFWIEETNPTYWE